ncbi:MAG: M56 family metallopeptidase [Gemmatimonadota bacterium]
MTATIAPTALAWLLTYAIHSTVLLGLAWAVTRVRRDPAIGELLWKAAMFGGLLTATIQLRLDVRPTGTLTLPTALESATGAGSATNAPGIVAGERVEQPVAPADPAASVEAPNDLTARNGVTRGPAPAPSSGLPADTIVVTLWAAVALVLALGYGARRLILVGRLTERQLLTEGPLPGMLAELCSDVGHRRRVVLTTAQTISSPVALGLGEICLPEAALTELHPELQRGMLAHELAHLSRRDPLWLDLASLLERLFFFQPLNRLARREMQTAAEFLADDWAAQRTGSGIPLARCLAKVAEWIQASPLGIPVAGMAEQRSMLVSRIARLIDGDSTKSGGTGPRRGAAAVALLALGATIAIAPGVSGRGRLAKLDGAADAQEQQQSADEGPGHPRGISAAVIERQARQASRDAMRNMARARIDMGGLVARVGRIDVGLNGSQAPADTNVVNALIGRLKDDDAQVRAAAARSLGRLEDPRAVPGLIVSLKDDNAKVRAAAADALAQFEDPRAIAPLVALLSDADSDVRQQALDALGNFEKGVPSAPVVRLLDDPDADIRHEAAHLLARLGDRAAGPALAKLVKDPSVDVRQAAIDALGEMQDASAGPAILGALGDANADVRQSALQALGEMKVAIPEATLRTLLSDASSDVRGATAEVVGERSMVSLVPSLQRLMQDANGDVRERAIDALSNIADQSARDALRAGLNSTDAKVRRRAAEALGERP